MKLSNYFNLKIIIVVCCMLQNLYGQQNYNDNIKKHTLFSAAVPGLGQVYNKKYWKVPIIYAGIGGTIYSYIYNNQKYKEYQSAYNAATDDNPKTINFSGYNTTNLITLQDYYRDSRDLSGFFLALIYLLNIIDASVDAHLINYNLNDNLSLYLNSKNQEIINLSLKIDL
tara:strand:- start:6310 stop:6819 length:510 start_codon:yes stop_codon:yes gene_type:complete